MEREEGREGGRKDGVREVNGFCLRLTMGPWYTLKVSTQESALMWGW